MNEIPLSLQLGETLGVFQLETALPSGLVGQAFESRLKGSNQLLFLKVISVGKGRYPGFTAAFNRYVRELKTLDHPHILPLRHAFQLESHHVLGFELAPLTLQKRLKNRLSGRGKAEVTILPLVESLGILEDICLGLNYLHHLKRIHGNLKPSNVLLWPKTSSAPTVQPQPDSQPISQTNLMQYSAQLADVGLLELYLAQLLERNTESWSNALEALPYSPKYVSPEQLNNQNLTLQSDIYQLGIIAYQVCTGRVPFEAKTLAESQQLQTLPPTPPIQLRPNLPLELSDLILACLNPIPELRPSGVDLRLKLLELRHSAGARDLENTVVLPLSGTQLKPPKLSMTNPNLDQPQLVILDHNGTRLSRHTLDAFGLKIGRAPSCGVQLEAATISYEHLSIVWQDGQALLTDLDSANGSLLLGPGVSEPYLTPYQSKVWPLGVALYLAPYWLALERPEIAQNDFFSLSFERPILKLPEGEAVNVRVLVKMQPPEWLRLRLEGLDPSWILEGQNQELPNVPQQTANFVLRRPADQGSAGIFPIQVIAESMGLSQLKHSQELKLEIPSQQHFELELLPPLARGFSRASYHISMNNAGNQSQSYRLILEDAHFVLRFDLQGGAGTLLEEQHTLLLELAAGETLQLELTVGVGTVQWWSEKRYPFEVRVEPASGGKALQLEQGIFAQKPRFSPIVLLSVVLIALAGLFLSKIPIKPNLQSTLLEGRTPYKGQDLTVQWQSSDPIDQIEIRNGETLLTTLSPQTTNTWASRKWVLKGGVKQPTTLNVLALRHYPLGLTASSEPQNLEIVPKPQPLGPPKLLSVKLERATVLLGQSVQLCWKSDSASQVQLEPLGLTLGTQGCQAIIPKTRGEQRLVLTARRENLASTSRAITLMVKLAQPQVQKASFSPNAITRGKTPSITLNYRSQNAEELRLRSQDGAELRLPPQGPYTLAAPNRSTRYALTARNAEGRSSDTLIEVTVLEPAKPPVTPVPTATPVAPVPLEPKPNPSSATRNTPTNTPTNIKPSTPKTALTEIIAQASARATPSKLAPLKISSKPLTKPLTKPADPDPTPTPTSTPTSTFNSSTTPTPTGNLTPAPLTNSSNTARDTARETYGPEQIWYTNFGEMKLRFDLQSSRWQGTFNNRLLDIGGSAEGDDNSATLRYAGATHLFKKWKINTSIGQLEGEIPEWGRVCGSQQGKGFIRDCGLDGRWQMLIPSIENCTLTLFQKDQNLRGFLLGCQSGRLSNLVLSYSNGKTILDGNWKASKQPQIDFHLELNSNSQLEGNWGEEKVCGWRSSQTPLSACP